MLFTQKLAEESALINIDFDIEEEERQFAFESMMNAFEINRIHCEAELVAIEAYKDYNGNMSVLESQFEVVKEEAEKGIIEKVKAWVIKAWNWIKNTVSKFKNWVVGLFSKQKAFINKYKDDETEINVNIVDFDKAKQVITSFSEEAKVMGEKIKAYYNDLKSGKTFPLPKTNDKFLYIMDNKSIFGVTNDYKSLESVGDYIKEAAMKNTKSASFKMKDFVKKLEEFSKIKDDTNISTVGKHAAKMAINAEAFFRIDTNAPVDGNVFAIDKGKTLLQIASTALNLLIKIVTGYGKAIKSVISFNMDSVSHALAKSKESK